MVENHYLEFAVILFAIFILTHKLVKPKPMDIYDLLDHDAKLITDAMQSQTKLVRLQYFHKHGIGYLIKKYKHKVEDTLLDDYLSKIDQTYLICKQILKSDNQTGTPCLN